METSSVFETEYLKKKYTQDPLFPKNKNVLLHRKRKRYVSNNFYKPSHPIAIIINVIISLTQLLNSFPLPLWRFSLSFFFFFFVDYTFLLKNNFPYPFPLSITVITFFFACNSSPSPFFFPTRIISNLSP